MFSLKESGPRVLHSLVSSSFVRRRILGKDFIPPESIRSLTTGGDWELQRSLEEEELAMMRDSEKSNTHLQHGHRSFEDQACQVEASTVAAADAADGDTTTATTLNRFFAAAGSEGKDVQRAMELNERLRKRMLQVMESNERSILEQENLAARIHMAEREKRKRFKDFEQGAWRIPLTQTAMEYTSGRSWFFSGAKYEDTQAFIHMSKHVGLYNKSGEWSQEERDGLVRGVEEMAKERYVLGLMDEVEYIEDFEELQREHGVSGLSLAGMDALGEDVVDAGVDNEEDSGVGNGNFRDTDDSSHLDATIIVNLPIAVQAVLASAEAMTMVEWETLAWRHVPKRSGRDCRLHWNNVVKPTIKKKPFTTFEQKKLKHLVNHHGEHAKAWELISEGLPGRTPLACLLHHKRDNANAVARSREKERRIGNLVFTEDDVKRVRQLVLKHGQAWKRIAKEFGGSWGPQQIMFEWRKHLQSTEGGTVMAKKGRWSKEEDDKLVKAVAVLGRQWAKVAQHVPGRTEMQVRERYVNHLDPKVESCAPFTKEEEELVMREVPLHTNPKSNRIAWAKVARLLPTRTDRQVKKAYERLIREAKKTRKRKGTRRTNKQPWDDSDDPCEDDMLTRGGR